MSSEAISQNQIQSRRIIAFLIILVLVFSVYIFRLFLLQVVQNTEWAAKAQENNTLQINLQSLRGIIYDRNDVTLSRNVAALNVVITAANLPEDTGAVQEIFRTLSELMDVPVNLNEISPENPYVPCISEHGIAQIAEYGESSTPYQPVRIRCDIDERTAMVLQEKSMDLPGIGIEQEPLREYPTGSLTSNIVGFLGPVPAALEDYYLDRGLVPNRDKVGYAGLELFYQDLLGGQNGNRYVQVD